MCSQFFGSSARQLLVAHGPDGWTGHGFSSGQPGTVHGLLARGIACQPMDGDMDERELLAELLRVLNAIRSMLFWFGLVGAVLLAVLISTQS